MKFFVIVCTIFLVTEAVKLPLNFKTCNRNQPNFKSCLLEAARHGVTQLNRPYKQLKMPSLDPLILPKIEASVATPTINITTTLTDCKFSGFIDTQIHNFEIDFEKKTIDLGGSWPEVRSQCDHYSLRGHIFNFPMTGEGSSSANFRNFNWTFNLSYEEVKKRGKTYVKPVTTDFDGKPKYLNIDLKDFFNGDKELSDRANKIINDNWLVLYDEVKDNYLNNAKKVWLRIMDGWFAKLSLEEAFDS